MPRTSSRTPSSTTGSRAWNRPWALLAIASIPFGVLHASAQAPPTARVIAEGRPAAPIPDDLDHFFERRRIKRTVPLDPQKVATLWDPLHGAIHDTLVEGAWFDWDDQYLYVAVQTASVTEVRIDLDGTGDGWLRGSDNLSVRVAPAAEGPAFCNVSARRWDNVQNKDRPVWAAAPFPEETLRAFQGRIGDGAVTVVAIPSSEEFGLTRKVNAEFGIRVSAGTGAASTDRPEDANRSLLRVGFADDVPAAAAGLTVRFSVGNRNVVPGGKLKGTLEARNITDAPITLKRFYYTGSRGTTAQVDEYAQNTVTLKPGDRLRRGIESTVNPSVGFGTFVFEGGVELEDGTRVAALTAADRIEPYTVELKLDDDPVSASALDQKRVRLAVVVVRSRSDQKVNGTVTLKLPEGWSAEGELMRPIRLSYVTEVKGASFKVSVPAATPPGEYPIQATVHMGERTYEVSTALRVVGN